MCEMRLDCPPCDVELLGDLRVGLAVRGERGNAVFGGSERVDTGKGRSLKPALRDSVVGPATVNT
jgi:hypothetical protein